MTRKAANGPRRRATRTEILEELQPRLISKPELAFLRDVQAFIDFGIRNGLTFQSIINPLLSDLNDIVREGFDFAKATAHGFRPLISKYARITADDFGESEEDAED